MFVILGNYDFCIQFILNKMQPFCRWHSQMHFLEWIVFWLKFHSILFLVIQLKIYHHWNRLWPNVVRQEAIIRNGVDHGLQCHMVSLGHNQLKYTKWLLLLNSYLQNDSVMNYTITFLSWWPSTIFVLLYVFIHQSCLTFQFVCLWNQLMIQTALSSVWLLSGYIGGRLTTAIHSMKTHLMEFS